ncbi:hypothetical protein KC19_4G096200 [Ceratodon purpureus]|uniref:Uncharacterized protein n=1 Tax=Ceratodon purpureus TaxID=3225 RepID=A0A8T0I8R2_CERPU|nr:hypothetical protein KC19_4G096200 [Ceratodon purpureus]
MGCADFLGCFKPQPLITEAARTVPNQPKEAIPTRASGAPSNETRTNGSKSSHAVGLRNSITKPPTSTLRNYNAIVEVSDNASEYYKEKPQPRIDWVIGLDFGTTYSGFAYARMEEDPQIHVYYEWPLKENERHYCKTLTGLYYKRAGPGRLECASWGYSARTEHMDHKSGPNGGQGHYLTKFKLLLKPASKKNDPVHAAVIPPPPPLTRDTVITDYLKCIGGLALSVLRSHVGETIFSKDSVKWCVTVPSIWDNNAKQKMKECMVNAGLVDCVEAVQVVLEPEAASLHCHEILRRDHQHKKDVSLNVRDKILVVDVGGGTVDIVVQELIASGDHEFKVRELTESSGGLCGGTFVDERFMRFISKKVGCLEEFLRKDSPSYLTKLLLDWEQIKCAFGSEMMSSSETMNIRLHYKLSPKWEAFEKEHGRAIEDSSVVELTQQDLKSIFDPVVDEILELIAAQLKQVPDIKVMFVVGGFAGSPYLMQRIRARFKGRVKHIVSPPSPGSAIVQGAVSLALNPEAIVSRVAKKTYGTSVMRPFDSKLDPPELLKVTDGKKYCKNRFDVFVKKGTDVEVNKLCVAKGYVPHSHGQRQIMFDLYSSTEQEPRYTVTSDTVTYEGGFVVDLPKNWSKDDAPEYEFSMYFGRSVIELKAERKISEKGGQEARTMSVPVKYASSL